ncbi:MAG TPA: SUMF1/EgtB/PvdO family nonheme iron enzyme [Hanamia sp.]
MKKAVLIFGWIILISINNAYTQQPDFQGDLKELFKGPSVSSGNEHWLSIMNKWRVAEKKSLNYHDSLYLKKGLSWTKKIFIYAQMMAEDRYFYDPIQQKYTVDRYLNDVKRRYGGLDAVLIWPTYPNIGIDNRNQFDLLADMPGGLAGVRKMVQDFKKRGVRVFFPIMIWDKGTRDIGMPMPLAIVSEMKSIGADGLNGDTMFGVSLDFLKAIDTLNYPIALQPEVAINDLKMVEWNQMSWGYFWNYGYVPGVSVYKWFEPKHQVQVTNRWMIDKTNDLQYAFFNGIGYNAWENIWGVWNKVPDRYAAAIRRIATIYRQFPLLWSSSEWQPYIPTIQKGIFASVFPGADQRIYTLVNRDSTDKKGRQIELPYQKGIKYFDVWKGKVLIPRKVEDHIYLNFPIEGFGFGAILAIKSYSVNRRLKNFLNRMQVIAKKPLKSYSTAWAPLQQHIVPIQKSIAHQNTPEGMVLIPGTKGYVFKSKGVMIEGNELPSAIGVQHPWEKHPSRSQRHFMNIASFFIDRYPVTNKQFKQFVDETKYHPKDDHNFLKDWQNGSYLPGWEEKPVTWVSIEDARAYAAWAGKRLPHEWEWEYAGQGVDGNLYPWGNKMDSSMIPQPDTTRNMHCPFNVTTFPKGISQFGVLDMVGNVWQWTDEYSDLHTRYSILKGASYYRPQSSNWYFPQAYELNKYAKYLLMSPGKDRSGTIGFRCVADTDHTVKRGTTVN